MNPILASMNNGPSILMSAFMAMMRGESPQSFMMNLAKTHPQLQGLDFSNMQETAQNVCNSHGVDATKLTNQLNQSANSLGLTK